MPFGLTADGFVAKTLEDVEAGFVMQQRANIDANIDTSQFELIGQLNGIMANEIAEVWELAEAVHDAMDPDKAVGAQQDALYALTNTLRLGSSKSTVVATVVLLPEANIAVGDAQASVAGNPSAKFVNAAAMVGDPGGPTSVDVAFESVAAGPVVANAGTLTVIDGSQIGWDSITNAEDAELGRLTESNLSYRVRRIEELAAEGGGTVPGIRADLLRDVPTVRAVNVIENYTGDVVDGLPAKSFEAVVRSVVSVDDDDAIAEVVWANKPAGIEPFGTETVMLLDSEGEMQTVHFSRPVARNVYVALRLKTDPAVYESDAAAKAALVASAEEPPAVGYLDVGADVYAGRLIAAAMALPGVLNADARLGFSPIGDFNTAASSLVISRREIAALDTGRIAITPFP